MATSEMTLFDSQGRRKYLCRAELERFLAAAANLPPRERAFCQTLVYSGGRLAEVLALRKMDIDRKQGAIVIKSLNEADARQLVVGTKGLIGDVILEVDGNSGRSKRNDFSLRRAAAPNCGLQES